MQRNLHIVFGWLMTVAAVWGQSTFGRLVGTVRDPSGATVAGATITAEEIYTGISVSSTSSAEGLYELPNLKGGRYVIVAVKAAFAPSATLKTTLDSRGTLRSDLVLNLPGLRESVTVEESAAPINTEDGSIADTKKLAEIIGLPLNYRASGTNPNSLLVIVPGVMIDRVGQASIAGGLPTQIEYSVDGISTANIRGNGQLVDIYPSPEAFAEYKVSSVNSGAEFGQMGDISVITRSGTNQFHGSLFWYHQNAAMDAKTYGAPVKQAKIYNAFGGSLGGPLVVPGRYSGKNRTFFFAAYEGNRKPATVLRQASVPTTEMWAGNLTGVPGRPALDLATGHPFPNLVIPSSRINPVATKLAGFYPSPNHDAGSTLNNNRVLIPDRISIDGYDIRVDHVITPRQQVMARWSAKDISLSSGLFELLPPSKNKQPNRGLVVSHNLTIRPTIMNELRLGVIRWSNHEDFPISGADAVAALGLQGLDLSGVGDGGGFPAFLFNQNGTDFTPIYHGREAFTVSKTLQLTDNLTWIRQKHSWKFGIDARRLSYRDVLHSGDNDEFGLFLFHGAFSGNAFADLLLGLPSLSQVGPVGPNLAQRTSHWHVYAQDQWQVSSRLTLTVGLRWQVHPPMTERSGNVANFDPVTGTVIVPDETLAPAPGFLFSSNACPGGSTLYACTQVVPASQFGLGPGLRKTHYGNWTPRFGFAFRPFRDSRTVLRGGIGSFTQTILGFVAYGMTGIHTSDVRSYENYEAPGIAPRFTFPQTYAGQFALRQPGTGSFAAAINPEYRDPRSYQWNITLERLLRPSISMRVSYVGTQSVGLTSQVELNQVPASNVPFVASRKPHPVWSSVRSLENVGFANYQSLQTEVTRRFGGMMMQGSYTLAKHLGNAGGPGGGLGNQPIYQSEYMPRVPTDRFNTRLDRGNLAASRRHRFALSGIFPIPLGKGRMIGTFNRFTDLLVGGWDLSTIVLLQSGELQTPTIAPLLDQSNTNAASRPLVTARPDRIGDGNLNEPVPDRFYDIAAFVPTPAGAGRFGNSGVGILRGPHVTGLSAGLSKTARINDQVRIRIEGTLTNVPNHPNFLSPAVNVSNPQAFGRLTTVRAADNGGNRTGQVSLRLEF